MHLMNLLLNILFVTINNDSGVWKFQLKHLWHLDDDDLLDDMMEIVMLTL